MNAIPMIERCALRQPQAADIFHAWYYHHYVKPPEASRTEVIMIWGVADSRGITTLVSTKEIR